MHVSVGVVMSGELLRNAAQGKAGRSSKHGCARQDPRQVEGTRDIEDCPRAKGRPALGNSAVLCLEPVRAIFYRTHACSGPGRRPRMPCGRSQDMQLDSDGVPCPTSTPDGHRALVLRTIRVGCRHRHSLSARWECGRGSARQTRQAAASEFPVGTETSSSEPIPESAAAVGESIGRGSSGATKKRSESTTRSGHDGRKNDAESAIAPCRLPGPPQSSFGSRRSSTAKRAIDHSAWTSLHHRTLCGHHRTAPVVARAVFSTAHRVHRYGRRP